jgi:hypothetical protein
MRRSDVATYQVLNHVDGSVVIIEMEAEHMHAVPTAISGNKRMVEYAEMLRAGRLTAYQIADSCGPYSELVRKDR